MRRLLVWLGFVTEEPYVPERVVEFPCDECGQPARWPWPLCGPCEDAAWLEVRR